MVEHLYVHIPFCPKICPYCSFYKEASDRNKTRPFLEAVLREAENFAGVLRPRTVFFGGGTPTALTPEQLEFLLRGLHERLDLGGVEEWTMEMNPATVSREKGMLLRELGVNRVSMGVQAWQPELLQTLGRVHTASQAERSYFLLREAGFDNVNLDLIFGVPGQTTEQWMDSLRRTAELKPEHISAYCLTYEEDTAFFESLQRGEFRIEEERDAELLLLTLEQLAAVGYEGYEISNFARPGRRCAHNLAYWQGNDYVGLGPSAFSTVGEKRWRNVRDTALYTETALAGKAAVDFSEEVTPTMRQHERLAFGLRLSDGVPVEWIDATKSTRLAAAGLLEEKDARWRITPAGRLVVDEVAAEVWE
jgi:oxygen-independent coproporphyrinogen-3 oxidase